MEMASQLPIMLGFPLLTSARSFFGQAPLMAIAIILAWLLVPSSIGTDKATASPQSKTSRLARVDFLGSFLIALTILAFMLPLELGGQKLAWSHPLIPALFGASVVCAALFAVTEARWAKEPVFPLALLRDRDTVTSFAVMALQVAAQLGVSGHYHFLLQTWSPNPFFCRFCR